MKVGAQVNTLAKYVYFVICLDPRAFPRVQAPQTLLQFNCDILWPSKALFSHARSDLSSQSLQVSSWLNNRGPTVRWSEGRPTEASERRMMI